MKANETITTGGREIPVRGLTRKELKELIGEGLNPAALGMAKADACMDRMFGMVLAPADAEYLQEQCNVEAVKVFKRILDLTYGREDDLKN